MQTCGPVLALDYVQVGVHGAGVLDTEVVVDSADCEWFHGMNKLVVEPASACKLHTISLLVRTERALLARRSVAVLVGGLAVEGLAVDGLAVEGLADSFEIHGASAGCEVDSTQPLDCATVHRTRRALA